MIGKFGSKIKSSLIFFRLPILSGFLIGTSFIPFPPWASFFGLVPLWIFWWKNPNPKHCFWGGWVTAFILTLIGFHWVAHTVHEFGHMPMPVALIVLLLFCAIGHLHFALAGLLWAWLAGKRRQKIASWIPLILLPILTAMAERYFPMIFVWNFGYTWMYSGLPFYQLAELIGFEGLSAWTIFTNLAFFLPFVKAQPQWRHWRSWRVAGAAIAVFLLANLWGTYLETKIPEADREVGVLVVQANIGNLEKQYAEKGWGFRDHIINRYTELTQQGLTENANQKIDFALWPETAFPDQIRAHNLRAGYARRLIPFLQAKSLALVTGSYSEDVKQGKATNSLFSFNAQGEMTDPQYNKTLLLAFGEYIPFGDRFPILKTLLKEVADFARGPGPSILNQGEVRLGAQICYEGLFPSFSKGLADQGAHLILNVTNDSWYGKSSEPYQHMYMTLARAIEFRRPVIRSTNTGFTTAITARGEIMERSPLHVEWHHLYRVPFLQEPPVTFFQVYGIHLVPALLWLLFVVATGGLFYRVQLGEH